MAFDKEGFKNYLRINFDEDDDVIESYWHGAEELVTSQVSIQATPQELSKYQMFTVAVRLLATFWYEVKMAVPQTASVKANTTEIPYGVTQLIYTLRARYFNDSKPDQYQDSDSETNSNN